MLSEELLLSHHARREKLTDWKLLLLRHALHSRVRCHSVGWHAVARGLLKLRKRHQEGIELVELGIWVHFLPCLHHRHLLKSLEALLLDNQCDLVVRHAVKLLQLLSILMVCQLFDVFGGGEGRGICAILFFFDYGVELKSEG